MSRPDVGKKLGLEGEIGMRRGLTYALAFTLIASTHAWGATLSLGDAAISFVMPTGMCEIDTKYPIEKRLFAFQAELLKGESKILSFFADCESLDALRSGKANLLAKYGLLLASLDLKTGAIEVLPGISREAFLASLKSEAPDVRFKEIWLEADKTLKSTGKSSFGYEMRLGPSSAGIAGFDNHAMYLALATTNSMSNGTAFPTAGIIAATILGNHPVNIALYSPSKNAATYVDLLRDSKKLVADLITRNSANDEVKIQPRAHLP